MTNVICDNCQKKLFVTAISNKVSIGIEVQKKGFIYKNACLFSDKYASLYFCSKECQGHFYENNIPKNPAITKTLNDLKSDIPSMAAECSKGLAAFISKLKDNKIL